MKRFRLYILIAMVSLCSILLSSSVIGATDSHIFTFSPDVSSVNRTLTVSQDVLAKSTGSWTCNFERVPATVFFGENNECFCTDTKPGFSASNSVGYGNIAECLRTGKNTNNMQVLFYGGVGGGPRRLNISIDYNPLFVPRQPFNVTIRKLTTGSANSSTVVACDGGDAVFGDVDVVYTYYKKAPYFTVLKRSYNYLYHLADSIVPIGVGDEIACQVAVYDGTRLVAYKESQNTIPIFSDIPLDVTYAYISPAYPKANATLHCTGYANYDLRNTEINADAVDHTYAFYADNVLLGTRTWRDAGFIGQGRTESLVDSGVTRGESVSCVYSAQLVNTQTGQKFDSDAYTSRAVTVSNSKPSKPEVSIYVS